MPDVNQFSFTHRELLTLLIKAADLHEGKWMMLITFGFTAGNFGPDEKSVMPGAIIAVQHVGLQRATPDSPTSIVVDAAEVNPK